MRSPLIESQNSHAGKQNNLNLIFEIIQIDDPVNTGKNGKYLRIRDINKVFYDIDIKEYQDKYAVALQERNPIDIVPTVSDSDETIQNDDRIKSETFDSHNNSELLTYLFSKINIDANQLSDLSDITITTDLPEILELPWEQIFDVNSVVYRKYFKNEVVNRGSNWDSNDLVILMSHAHEGLGYDLTEVMNQEIRSIYDTLHYLRDNNLQSFRIDNILLSKHTTRNSIGKLDWKSYNYVHFISHGTPNGDLALEKDDKERYKYPDTITKGELLNILNSYSFNLVFLSICFSGGGTKDEDSIAYQLVKNGITNYCIGYRGYVGEETANNFTKLFYEQLTLGGNISETFKKSYKTFRSENKKIKYIPYLYMS
jgi:hypothetical protein